MNSYDTDNQQNEHKIEIAMQEAREELANQEVERSSVADSVKGSYYSYKYDTFALFLEPHNRFLQEKIIYIYKVVEFLLMSMTLFFSYIIMYYGFSTIFTNIESLAFGRNIMMPFNGMMAIYLQAIINNDELRSASPGFDYQYHQAALRHQFGELAQIFKLNSVSNIQNHGTIYRLSSQYTFALRDMFDAEKEAPTHFYQGMHVLQQLFHEISLADFEKLAFSDQDHSQAFLMGNFLRYNSVFQEIVHEIQH